MKYGWTRYTRYSIREPKEGYGIWLWKQPMWRWWISQVYHWYDSHIYKVPGFKKFERWLWNRYDNRNDNDADFLYIPLSCRQDIRCDQLGHKRRTFLAQIELTKEQFDAINKDHGG